MTAEKYAKIELSVQLKDFVLVIKINTLLTFFFVRLCLCRQQASAILFIKHDTVFHLISKNLKVGEKIPAFNF